MLDGTGSLQVTYSNPSGGCTLPGTTTQNITINPLPTPTITPTTAVCANSTGNIYTTQFGSGIHGYQWNVTGGAITSGGGPSDSAATYYMGSCRHWNDNNKLYRWKWLYCSSPCQPKHHNKSIACRSSNRWWGTSSMCWFGNTSVYRCNSRRHLVNNTGYWYCKYR